MIWKITTFLLLLCVGVMSFFLFLVPENSTIVLTKTSAKGLSKTRLVADLKNSMTQLMENNRKIEHDFSEINAHLAWYQKNISPLVDELGGTVSTTAKIASYLPGTIGKASDNVRIITALGKNISYYSHLVGSAEKDSSVLHQQMEQFITHEDTQELFLILQEIKTYQQQTNEALKHLDNILPILKIANDIFSKTEVISKDITNSIMTMFFDKAKKIQKGETDNSSNDYKAQLDNIYKKINTVNMLLKNGLSLANEIKMYIFILNKYQKTLESKNINQIAQLG